MHASLIDGCKLARAAVHVFEHGDADSLDAVLRDATAKHRRVLVVLDGVYSMDGDLAPLAELVPVAKRHGAMVLVDDAHGCGALGANGRGTAELLGVEDGVDVLVGTLGKALGSFGAFVAGSAALRELLVNTARPFIFSCALAPPQVEAARAALRLVAREPWRRERLQANAARLRDRLAQGGHLDRAEHHARRAGRDRRQRGDDGDLRAPARARLLRAGHPLAVGSRRHRAPAHHADGDARGGGDRRLRRRARRGTGPLRGGARAR